MSHPITSAAASRPAQGAASLPTSAQPALDLTNEHASADEHARQGGLSSTTAAGSAQFASQMSLRELTTNLKSAIRQFPDWPEPGILFEDILPIFADAELQRTLIDALALKVAEAFNNQKPDIIVGLEARGFLFGPSLSLRLGSGFVPIRKKGKLPGPTHSASYKKEYGEDVFEIQSAAIRPGQKVLIVDDIIATGGTAAAAGSLVKQLDGDLLGYLFMMELDFLKGREKLDGPVHTLFSGQEEKDS